MTACLELEAVLRAAGQGALAAQELLRARSQPRRALVCRALLWPIKLDMLRVVATAP